MISLRYNEEEEKKKQDSSNKRMGKKTKKSNTVRTGRKTPASSAAVVHRLSMMSTGTSTKVDGHRRQNSATQIGLRVRGALFYVCLSGCLAKKSVWRHLAYWQCKVVHRLPVPSWLSAKGSSSFLPSFRSSHFFYLPNCARLTLSPTKALQSTTTTTTNR